MLPVQIEVSPLADALKLHEIFPLVDLLLFQEEMFPIPTHGIRQVNDILAESLVAVKGIGQRHLLPSAVIITRRRSILDVAYSQAPSAIEVQFLPLLRQQWHVQQKCRDK